MTLDDWYAWAATDAERRDLPDLTPVLKGLHTAAAALRAAAWNDDARGHSASSSSSSSSSSSASSTPDVTASQPSPRASS